MKTLVVFLLSAPSFFDVHAQMNNAGDQKKIDPPLLNQVYYLLFQYSNGIIIRSAISGLNIEKTNASPDKLFLGPYSDVLQKK
ncbi:MAG TPA: hypothetical protein VNV85_09285 [Puia sp.]|jgi:hypothetical protein|nr:hypothetical protein [Puia sp.]